MLSAEGRFPMTEATARGPIIIRPQAEGKAPPLALEAKGQSLVVTEVAGGGAASGAPSSDPRAREVAPLHVHHDDDEAWYVISGALRFRFADEVVEAEAGSIVFVPAGVAHTFGGDARYLLILTRRLNDLIAELHATDRSQHADVFRKYRSELVE
jgi:mannose-6-phosphate isomerase-like protein (cupin superfamily)